ncbi:hypothetical protein ACIA03_27570 [Nocardioides sp. NPDC051685]|uniref:hypothetical protein n=1 Tax=Nocardioides sp. NPDC051685 TaxID=3364334 RepID=UPI0037ACA293
MPSCPTTRRAKGRFALTLCSALLLMTACGAEATLLDSDELPDVEKTINDAKAAPGGGWCDELAYLETSMFDNAADGKHGEQYQLKNGDLVGAAVFGPGGRFADAASMLAGIEAAVTECTADAAKGDYGEATSEPLTGLPDGAVGFTFTSSSSNPRETGKTAYAETTDGNLLSVGVTHYGEGEPSVDVNELLSTALKQVAEIDGEG